MVGDEDPPAPGISRKAGLGLDGFCTGVDDDPPAMLLVTMVISELPATIVREGSLDLIFSVNFFFLFQIFLSYSKNVGTKIGARKLKSCKLKKVMLVVLIWMVVAW